MLTVYGISNCDTVRKARRWLATEQIEYLFHDLRKDGISVAMVAGWLERLPASQLLNKRSTTWKQLSDQEQLKSQTDELANLLVRHPTLIKRPVFVTDSLVIVGFSDNQSQLLLKNLQEGQ